MTSLSPHNLEQYRQQFPALAQKAYFNYGGQGPLPQAALAAIATSHTTFQTLGPFSGKANTWITEETLWVRRAIAKELGAPPETITLTENVSAGCNIPLWGIDWQEGDHILMSNCEHPGIVAAVQAVQQRFGVKVSTCPLMETLNQGNPVAVIEQHLRPSTRLVVVSHILWNTGQVLPLKEIAAVCHAFPAYKGTIRLLVDAAQSVGVLPLDLTDLQADFYAFTGHKWWCGPAGLGGLYIRPDALAALTPTFIGWRGITADPTGEPTGWQPGGKRFEVATSDYALFAGLREAIALHHQWGTPQERYQQICRLSQQLWQQLQQIPGLTCLKTTAPEAGLVSFQLAGYDQKPYGALHQTLVDYLENQNIYLRTIRRPDCVRACVHYLSDPVEIEQVVTAIAQFPLTLPS